MTDTTFETPELGAYLIIARYDHDRWSALNESERYAAKNAAEELFPYEVGKIKDVSALKGVQLARTFASGLFASIPPGLNTKPFEKRSDKDWTVRNSAVKELLANLPRKISRATARTAQDVSVDDPGIGWIAVVDQDDLPTLLESLGATKLGKIYNIEVIPLNNDQNSKHIYQRMTAVSWT